MMINRDIRTTHQGSKRTGTTHLVEPFLPGKSDPSALVNDDDDENRNHRPKRMHQLKLYLLGLLFGLVVQALTFAACAMIGTRWGKTPKPSTNGDYVLYGLLSLASKMDLIMFSIVGLASTLWMMFGILVCKSGTTFYLRNNCGVTTPSSRIVSTWGAIFGGMVLGSFLISVVVEEWLGKETPYLTLLALGGSDLILFLTIVYCPEKIYNLFEPDTDDSEEPCKMTIKSVDVCVCV